MIVARGAPPRGRTALPYRRRGIVVRRGHCHRWIPARAHCWHRGRNRPPPARPLRKAASGDSRLRRSAAVPAGPPATPSLAPSHGRLRPPACRPATGGPAPSSPVHRTGPDQGRRSTDVQQRPARSERIGCQTGCQAPIVRGRDAAPIRDAAQVTAATDERHQARDCDAAQAAGSHRWQLPVTQQLLELRPRRPEELCRRRNRHQPDLVAPSGSRCCLGPYFDRHHSVNGHPPDRCLAEEPGRLHHHIGVRPWAGTDTSTSQAVTSVC